jgi:succinate dehydrogenase / fumarate reductase membrane anchor subunit
MMLSAKNHWIVLRVTAIAAIPLCIWLILNIVGLIGAPYEVFTAWLQSPVNAVLMILFVIVNFYHAALGCHEIIEDYVHNETLKNCSLKLKALAFFIVAAVCVYAIVKVAFL